MLSLIDGKGRIFLAIVAIVAIGAVALNAWAPVGSPFHVPNYMVSLIGKYLCYALLALSVDLDLGICWNFEPWPRRILRAWRIRHGHAPDA